MFWHIQIEAAPGHADRIGDRLAALAVEIGVAGPWLIGASRGFLIEGGISRAELDQRARSLLVDPVVEGYTIRPAQASWEGPGAIVHVMPKPGVTDPEAENALALLRDLDHDVVNVRTIRTYRIEGPADSLPRLISRVLANDAVELAVVGPIPFDRLGGGQPYRFERIVVPLRGRTDHELMELSRKGQLAL
jgi:phosphoribosylformylglycinamidine synthase subunit PurSL